MDKLDKIDKIVDKEVDDMSLEDLKFNLKVVYRENYYTYTDWQINELYNQMMKETPWSNDENEEERKGEHEE